MNFLTNNFHIKIVALVSAVILWFFVVGIENSVYLFPQDIEIKTQNMPVNLSLSSSLGNAKVRVTADSATIKNLSKADLEIFVDLKDLAAGDYTLPLQAKSTNEKVTILKIEPPAIHIKLQSVQEKEVKIKVTVSGNPQKGFKVDGTKLDQTTAKISGVKELLDKLNELSAEIKLDGTQDNDFNQNVKLELPKSIRESAPNVTIVPDQVSVAISITPEPSEIIDTNSPNPPQQIISGSQKVVVVRPNLKGSIDPNRFTQKIEVTPLTVVIQGESDVLKNVNFLETEPVQIAMLQNQTKAIKVRVILPPQVTLVNPLEKEVTISLKAGSTP